MKKITGFLRKLFDFYELHLSAILLSAVVALFCAQIFIRYIVNGNTFYVYEASIICFGWTSIVGASYGFRRERRYGDGHVRFTILSDLLKGKAGLWLQAALSAVTVAGMAWMFVPCARTVWAYRISKTTILHIPFSYIYFPFLIFLVLASVHELENMVFYLRKIFSRSGALKDEQTRESGAERKSLEG